MTLRVFLASFPIAASLGCAFGVAGVAAAENEPEAVVIEEQRTSEDYVDDPFEKSSRTLRSEQRGRIFEFWFPSRQKETGDSQRRHQRDDQEPPPAAKRSKRDF